MGYIETVRVVVETKIIFEINSNMGYIETLYAYSKLYPDSD